MKEIYESFFVCLIATMLLFSIGIILLYSSSLVISESFKIVLSTSGSIAFAFSIFGILVCIFVYPTKEERR